MARVVAALGGAQRRLFLQDIQDMVRRRSASIWRCACSTRSNSCAASRVLPEPHQRSGQRISRFGVVRRTDRRRAAAPSTASVYRPAFR